MIGYFLYKAKYLHLFLMHAALGIFSALFPPVFIGWIYLVIISEYNTIFGFKKNHTRFTALMVYVSSLEIIGRMARVSPYVPYELSKYFMAFMLVMGIIKYQGRYTLGMVLLALLIPGFILDESGQRIFLNIVFNGFGVLNIALGVIYFYKRKIEEADFENILRLAAYALTAALFYVFYKTPSYDEIEFSYTVAKSTSGSFGSNQVSTALGVGAFLVYLLWFNKIPFSGNQGIDLGIIGLFFIQAILTFSRGGVIGAVLSVVLLLLYFSFAGKDKKVNIFESTYKSALLLVLAIISFLFVNLISDNKLYYRYKGETEASLEGDKEITINSITSNRYDIFFGDLAIWAEHPIFGAGVGSSEYIREFEEERTAAHVELSRLLAEHGLMGLLFFLLLTYLINPIIQTKHADKRYNAIMFSLFILALYSTFHAALRTYISPLFLTMTLMVVVPTIKKQNTTI